MKITYLSQEKQNWFLVTWDLANKCNYRCSYCPDILHNGTSGWPDYKQVINFIDRINELLPNKKICFRFSGGEPTYWNMFVHIAEYIKLKKNYFSFLTNASRDIEYFKNINKFTDGVILSYHPEYAKTSKFIDIANSLDCPVAVNLMLLPENFDHTVSIAKEIFENSKAAIWPKVILDKTIDATNTTLVYTIEQKQLIDSWPYFRKLDDFKIHRGDILLDGIKVTANDLLLKELNRYTGWNCWGGIDMLHVNAFREVYRSDCKQNKIGTIDNFILPSEPDICTKVSCSCLSDLYLRKES
jgi:organic radical activating enzyme